MEELTVLPFDSELSHILSDPDPARPYVYVSDLQNNLVHVISTRDNSLAKSIVVGTKPYTLVLDEPANRLYVGLIGSWAIECIDLNTLAVIDSETIDLNFAPYYFAIDRTRGRIYASTIYDTQDHSYFEGSRIVDLATSAPIDSVFPRGPIVYDPVNALLYVNSIADIFMYDVSSDVLIRTLENEVEEVGDPIDLVSDPDLSVLYLLNGRSSLKSSIVEVFECRTLKKIAELDTESVPRSLALSHDGTEIFVIPSEPISKTGGNFVIRYDARTYQRRGFYRALGKPGERGLAVTPNGSKLFLIAENPYYISDDPYGNVRHDIQVIDL